MTDAELLAVRGVSKTFGSTRALADASLDVASGEVHALLGQNGSGKSTLIKILSGYHEPDAGSVRVKGENVRLPLAAHELRRRGVAFVHQDLGLVDTMSVLENLRVGRYETGVGFRIRWRSERERARRLLERFELAIDPSTPVGRLSQTARAIVAIIRALDEVEHYAGAGLLVLDEPTSALPEHEIGVLFDALRRVTEAGSAILFVTHRVEEVFAVADVVTVLRDGRRVAAEPISGLDERSLIALILGRELGELYPDVVHETAEPILSLEGVSGSVVRDVSFSLREKEILGLTGLIGAGHDELPYLVYGAAPPAAGVIRLGGTVVVDSSPRRAQERGIVLLPADRQRHGGIARATVKENVTLPVLRRYRRAGRLDHRRERRDVRAALRRFRVHPPLPDRPLATLSGGNQQKALLARWIETRPRVLLLHEPTQGVDVGSRREIFEILRDTVAAGSAIVYASVEYEDLARLCDRVLVFRRGRLVRELAGGTLTKESIVEACTSRAR